MLSYSRFHVGARVGVARGGRVVSAPVTPRARRKPRMIRRPSRPQIRAARRKVRPAAVSAGFPAGVARFGGSDDTSPEGDLLPS